LTFNGTELVNFGGTSVIFTPGSLTTGIMRLVSSNSSNYIQSGLSNIGNSAAPLIFGTINSSDEWARFTTTGSLGIGTTVPAGPTRSLHVLGGLTLGFGYRPVYFNVTTSSISTLCNVHPFGTHFNITNSGFSNVAWGFTPVFGGSDSNAYYVFRNNTGTYLSVTMQYTGGFSSAPNNPVTIAPANSVTIMVTNTGSGGSSNYVLF
jgi:hypothetical protein